MTKKTGDIRWSVIPLNSDLKKTERDFFQIPVEDLIERGLTATKAMVDLQECTYIDKELLEAHGFNSNKEDTTVLNFPTNSAKSTLFYDLIENYAAQEDTIVIVCSPFIKLVEKDFTEIKRRIGTRILRYDERTELFVGKGYVTTKPQVQRFNVHVMTVNCLLQNPGGLTVETSEAKQEYLSALLRYATEEGKRVILFIDEIHESVQNFHVEYLPHLAKWRKLLHKVFVASATFTVSSYMILQQLARFTEDTITVYESLRNRELPNRASLTVHIVKEHYRDTNLEALQCLFSILGDWEKGGTKGPINILTGHSNLARQLRSNKNPLSLSKQFPELNFKLMVAGEKNTEFVDGGNHLGTLFKTGVNIDEPNNLLVIILPYTYYMGEQNEKIPYGIFTDGIPSLVQSLGRQRKGGECHVILAPPVSTISGTNLTIGASATSFFPKVTETYKHQSTQFKELVNGYKKTVEGLAEHIKFLYGSADGEKGIGSYYPSLQDSLLENSRESIIRGSLSGGKGLSAYLLWAALNDQFEGVKLKAVKYWKPMEKLIELSPNPEENWRIISELFPNLVPLKSNLPSAYYAVYETLFVKSHESRLRFKLGDQLMDAKKAAKDSRVLRTILGSVFHHLGREGFPDLKEKNEPTNFAVFYLRQLFTEKSQDIPESLNTVMKDLHAWKIEFLEFLGEHSEVKKRSKRLEIDPKIEEQWSMESKNQFTGYLSHLKEVDPILKTGAVKLSALEKKNTFRFAFRLVVGEIDRKQKRKRIDGKSVRMDRWVLPSSIVVSHELQASV